MINYPPLLQEREEHLSLANFNPVRAQHPYLNSPRSLEACRVHGVNPIELAGELVSERERDFNDINIHHIISQYNTLHHNTSHCSSRNALRSNINMI